ncbi:MAG: hypothetical protein H6548_11415 [Chitinophagales bacterium]|nr:hypothetical protein [Chitinophagales bacterium]MCB9019732.1 hypothetical protein [Chitinophagales bacterium]MCB9022717.1 hypothetical protein [Chitinophagales bacterium]HPE98184.1 hypothetical protein [Chitinophagales bacterium]HPR28327.1 hypothetical protein [Chitinophagales bacterium]
MGRDILVVLIMMFPFLAKCQVPEDFISHRGNLITVRFNLKNEQETRELARYFEVDFDSLSRFHDIGKLVDEGWFIMKEKKNLLIIARSMDMGGKFDWLYVAVPVAGASYNNAPGYPRGLPFGFNEFKDKASVFPAGDSSTVFMLYGHSDAGTVMLSGNFNDWSTGATPMEKVADGWMVRVPLREGQHYYKFIVDGRWMSDPQNKHDEGDGYGGSNSVYFKTNHVMRLSGYREARKVILAGSFNQWDEHMCAMQQDEQGWYLPVYLKEGTYTYKYIVDKKWITDPDNPVSRADAEGNINSVLSLGQPTVFRLPGYSNARQVVLSGNFNEWDPGELLMTRTSSGWELPYVLAPGNYEYKFVVDGNWIQDPDNPLHYADNLNSNSILTVQANHRFFLKGYENAGQVQLSGSFNGWAFPGYNMQRVAGGWEFNLYLPPGKSLYRFIVDGNWMADPGNNQREFNEYGDFNSIIWREMKDVYTYDK